MLALAPASKEINLPPKTPVSKCPCCGGSLSTRRMVNGAWGLICNNKGCEYVAASWKRGDREWKQPVYVPVQQA